MAACLLASALSACGPRIDPIEQVRVIAGRPALGGLPPVPGADGPYPSLGSVPPRPTPTPIEERRRIADALVADRANARHTGRPDTAAPAAAALAPPPAAEAPPPAPVSPLGFAAEQAGIGGVVAPNPAVVPPAPVPPIAGAPQASPVVAEPLPPQAQPPAAADMPPRPAAPPPAAPAGPSLAAAPPADPPPRSDPSVTVDRSALPPPSRTARAEPLPPGQGAALAFPPGSAILPVQERSVIARFAAGRGGAMVRVTGFVDSSGGDLGLALARAQAVAQALRAAGLPAEAIELGAEPRPGPAGRGAEMRLVY